MPYIERYLAPVEVEAPASITMLESAITLLGKATGSKFAHLSTLQAQALLADRQQLQMDVANQSEYVSELEAANARLQKQLAHLEDRVVSMANRNKQTAPMWVEERAE